MGNLIMDEPLEIHLDWGDDFQQTLDISMLARKGDGRARLVGILVGDDLPEEVSYRTTRVGFMRRSSAQWLMDRLWGLGIRPSDEGTPGQMKAMDNHLQDMRLMANQLLNFVLVQIDRRGTS